MRRAKLVLVAGGVVWLAGWVAWGSQAGFDGRWIFAGAAIVALYAIGAWYSYRGERGRLVGVSTAAALTLVVGIISFFHLALVLGGLAVTAGCALRPS